MGLTVQPKSKRKTWCLNAGAFSSIDTIVSLFEVKMMTIHKMTRPTLGGIFSPQECSHSVAWLNGDHTLWLFPSILTF